MELANIFGFGNPVELAIIGVVVMVLFGASKVGQFGKSLGEGLREFKKAAKDDVNPPLDNASQAPADLAQSAPKVISESDENLESKTPSNKE
jgi:sec-independent protein translocase protein TatA